MCSPAPTPPFASSALADHHQTPKSRFTYKHLSQLKSYIPSTPLRTIAHIDLDAFYAQCETVRLGLDPSLPLAVQQWRGLIAINYPARAHGLTRHIPVPEARKLCPDIILQHVATWKEGEEGWKYREEGDRDIQTQKVSLDYYRKEGRRILGVVKECLPVGDGQRVEKASIDEVFLDLSAQVYGLLLERYPELRGPPPYDDSSEFLPKPSSSVVDWKADEVVGTGDECGEGEDPDWDDVCLGIASEIVRDIRGQIKEQLGYTCSGGIARNKMLAKLGSGYKKPNQQTVIRNRAIKHFLSGYKFTKIRMLGGKLGDEAVAMFGTDMVKDLLEQPLDQLKRLGDDTGSWLYSIIRGEDYSEVNPRTQIKSMLSAKAFRPAINSFEHGVRWLKIFVADIFSRCVEEGVLENKRRPKTINLHHKQGNQTRSRQSPIPQGKPLSEALLFDLAKNLLAQLVVDGRAWPCINLSLSVGGWEDGVTNNKGIRGFLVSGEEAKSSMATGRSVIASGEPPRKRRKKGNIASFFGPRDEKKKDFDAARAVLKSHRESTMDEEEVEEVEEEEEGVDDFGAALPAPRPRRESTKDDNDRNGEDEDDDSDSFEHISGPSRPRPHPDQHVSKLDPYSTPPSAQYPIQTDDPYIDNAPPSGQHHAKTEKLAQPGPPHKPQSLQQQTVDKFFCPRCNVHLPSAEEPEHNDFHFAMDLSKEMRQEERTTPAVHKKPTAQKPTRGRGRPPGGGRGSGKGQAKLAF